MRLGQSAIGEWNDDDYDVLADGVVVGRIMNGAGKHVVDVDARARSHTRLRRDARGRHYGIRKKLAAGVKALRCGSYANAYGASDAAAVSVPSISPSGSG
jgi:hypothetical protein